DDIVRRVRDVLSLLWGDRAEAIEDEACQILGVPSLRYYFRQPKHFFDFHIKRYSKSRRKAPIYWLLQSAKKNYGLWLYCHRIDRDTLFKALTLYADPKINLENIRLNDLRGQLASAETARERRSLEKAVAKQEALIGELADFRNELERIARLGLTPDFNDGVIISIAPLHNLVPWKEAAKMWAELESGKYDWSAMSQRMRGG
ncbi:MAG TPA: SAM-dependent methyltransferase, partial [Anaerolineae bacterium]